MTLIKENIVFFKEVMPHNQLEIYSHFRGIAAPSAGYVAV